MSPECQSLIKRCLDPNQTTRLGANGAHEVKKHPFFAGVDWKMIKKQPASIQPEIIKVAAKGPTQLKEIFGEEPGVENESDKKVENDQKIKNKTDFAPESFAFTNHDELHKINQAMYEKYMSDMEHYENTQMNLNQD